jgi:hypothetical protein
VTTATGTTEIRIEGLVKEFPTKKGVVTAVDHLDVTIEPDAGRIERNAGAGMEGEHDGSVS